MAILGLKSDVNSENGVKFSRPESFFSIFQHPILSDLQLTWHASTASWLLINMAPIFVYILIEFGAKIWIYFSDPDK